MTDVDPKTAPAEAPQDEFAQIPSRRPRSALVAVGAILLAGYLAFHVRKDVSFALSTGAPVDLGDARALAARGGELPLNRSVRLTGLPDRESAVILDTQGSWTFAQFFRLLGTDNRVLVRRLDDPLPVDRTDRDVFIGRLVRLADLSINASIRAHFERHVSSTHFFAPAALLPALGKLQTAGPTEVTDTSGDRVKVTPEEVLLVDVIRRGELRIEVPKDRFGTVQALAEKVTAAGGTVTASEPPAAGALGDKLVVIARLPEQRDQALSALEQVDRRVQLRQARTTLRTRVADLRVDGASVHIKIEAGQTVQIPVADLAALRTTAPMVIPSDAVVVLEGDRPRDHFRTLVVLAFLLVFAAVNLIALRRQT